MKRYQLGVMTASLAVVLGISCGHQNPYQEPDESESPAAAETPASSTAEPSAADTTTITLQGAATDTDFTGRVEVTPEGTGVRIVADFAGVDTDGQPPEN